MEYIFSEDAKFYFPAHRYADEQGCLAIGGDLLPERLIFAYKNGIFPWYSDDSPIMWWSPDPRFVLVPDELKVSKSMKQILKSNKFDVTYNHDFENVIKNCSNMSRKAQDGTWIIEEIIEAYLELHKKGIAQSVEVWENGTLVGGLYGVILGKVFFGESMFAKVSNASKFGFIRFVEKLKSEGIVLIDCQQETVHLGSLGAKAISRSEFLEILKEFC